MTDETVADILGGCTNDHCLTLGDYLFTDDTSLDDLGYEDVFYPLRCHHDEGLALELGWNHGVVALVWGSGDFIYKVNGAGPQKPANAVDPFIYWGDIQRGNYSLDTTIVDDHRQEE